MATNSAGVRYSSPANLYVRGRELRQAEAGTHRPTLSHPTLGSWPPGSPVLCRPEQEGPDLIHGIFRVTITVPWASGGHTDGRVGGSSVDLGGHSRAYRAGGA